MALKRMSAALDQLVSTPWGVADEKKEYGEGITFYGTSSHGGFKLDRARNAKVHPALRESGGWYEEDSAWAKVAFTFPERFSENERESAARTLKQWYPDAWEAVTGTIVAPGESYIKDERLFREKHANDLIVISAISSKKHPGMVECIATKGGIRAEWGKRDPEELRCLVPAGEYGQRSKFGFVVDPARHQPFDDK